MPRWRDGGGVTHPRTVCEQHGNVDERGVENPRRMLLGIAKRRTRDLVVFQSACS